MKRLMAALLTALSALLVLPIADSPAGAATPSEYALHLPTVAWLQARGSAVAMTVQVTCPRKAGKVFVNAVVSQAASGDVHLALNDVSAACTGAARVVTVLATFTVPLSVPFSPGSAQLSVDMSFLSNDRVLDASRVVALTEHSVTTPGISSLTRAAGGAAFIVTAPVQCSKANTLDVIGTASQRVGPTLVQRGILRQYIQCRPPQTVVSLYVPAPRRPWTKAAAVIEITAVCANTCRDIEAIRTFGESQ